MSYLSPIYDSIVKQVRQARLNDLWVLYLFILLSAPQVLFTTTSLYIFRPPASIKYGFELLHEPISYLYIPIILKFFYKNSYKANIFIKNFFYFLIILFFSQIIRGIFYDGYLFINHRYELIFVYFCALCFSGVLFSRHKTEGELFSFYELLILIHGIALLISMFLPMADDSGRHNAQNLNYGITGFLFGTYCVYNWFVKKNSSLFTLVLSLLALILSGSRINIYITIGFFSYYVIVTFINKESLKFWYKRTLPTISVTIIIISLGLSYQSRFTFNLLDYANNIYNDNLSSPKSALTLEKPKLTPTSEKPKITSTSEKPKTTPTSINRGLSITSFDDLLNDPSYKGRVNSIITGLKILYDEPLGITFSFVDLQRNMNIRGYPTFPHQNILAIYLVMGPLFLVIIFWFFKIMKILIKTRNQYRFVFYYILAYSLVAGGCPHSVKVVFIYMFLLFLGARITVTVNKTSPNESITL